MDIVTREEEIFVGIPCESDWQGLWEAMPNTWRSFFDRYEDIQYRKAHWMCDLSLAVNQDKYLQLVSCPVEQLAALPEGMCAVKLAAQSYLYHPHTGELSHIAQCFAAMYQFAEQHHIPTTALKLDMGYTPQGKEACHHLYIALSAKAQWEWLSIP